MEKKMEKEAIKTKMDDFLKGTFLSCLKIDVAKYHPHPYMIGASHVAWASDHWGGLLSEEVIKEGEKRGKCRCMQRNCTLPYEDHTVEYAFFFQLKRDVTKEEFTHLFDDGLKECMNSCGVELFCLVETPEKYRIK